MNSNEIVKHMIDFIEDKERQLQSDSSKTDAQKKKEAVKAIVNELDKECKDENQ